MNVSSGPFVAWAVGSSPYPRCLRRLEINAQIRGRSLHLREGLGGPKQGFLGAAVLREVVRKELSSNLTSDKLRTLFQSYGVLNEIEIVTDINTRYSRGFAFCRDDK